MGTMRPISSDSASFFSAESDEPFSEGSSRISNCRLDDLQLAAAIVGFHFSVQGHDLSGLELVPKIGGVEPDTLQARPPLSGCHLENGHAAGTEQSGIADLGDDGRHLSRTQFGDGARVQAVFVAEWQIMQQVVDGVDALARQHLGQAGADAFHILHGSGRIEHLKRW